MRERIWPDAFRRPPAFFVFVRHGFTRLSHFRGILCPTRGVRTGKANFSQGAYSLPAFCLGILGILGILGSLVHPPWLHSAKPSPGNPLSHERDPDRQGQFQSRRLFSSCVLSGYSGFTGLKGNAFPAGLSGYSGLAFLFWAFWVFWA